MAGRAAIIFAITGAALVLTAAAAAALKPVHPIGEPVQEEFAVSFSPKDLPRAKQVPVSVRTVNRFWREDGGQVPALEELQLFFDPRLRLDLTGTPPCRGGYLDVRGNGPDKTCPDSIVGRGRLDVDVRHPDQPPADVSDKLTVFKGPWRGGPPGLYVHAELEAPVVEVLVTPLKIELAGSGAYLEAIAEFPEIAGGAGSITRLELRFRKGIFSARCPRTGSLRAAFRARFADGAALRETESPACD